MLLYSTLTYDLTLQDLLYTAEYGTYTVTYAASGFDTCMSFTSGNQYIKISLACHLSTYTLTWTGTLDDVLATSYFVTVTIEIC
jgi:hypothetical protein